MKIDGNNLGGLQPESPLQKPGTEPEAARKAARIGYRNPVESSSEATPGPTPDEVSLSGLGRELSRLTNHANAERETRIEKLAADYEQGGLAANDAATARKLVDDAFHNE